MNIDKYINWHELYDEEIDLSITVEYVKNRKHKELINDFLLERNMDLMHDECSTNNKGDLIFFFGETGGQNESDTQGWSRDYCIVFNKNLDFKSIEYSQG